MLINILPFYFLLLLNTACSSTGTAAFVADQRKGVLRHFLLVPVGQAMLLCSNVVSIIVMALIQSLVLLGVVSLYGEVPQVDVAAFLVVLVAGASMLTAMGFAAQSFKPSETAKGAEPLLLPVMILAVIAMQIMILSDPTEEVSWAMLANPVGPLMDLIRQTLTGGPGFNPAWMSYAMIAAWTALAGGIATARFTYSLEPDWTRR